MGKSIRIQNKNYQTPVKSFNWNENRNALVVTYYHSMSKNADTDVMSSEFFPVPKKFYNQLKDEVERQEKLVNKNYWFFQDIRRPNNIRERIETESSVSGVEMRHGISPN